MAHEPDGVSRANKRPVPGEPCGSGARPGGRRLLSRSGELDQPSHPGRAGMGSVVAAGQYRDLDRHDRLWLRDVLPHQDRRFTDRYRPPTRLNARHPDHEHRKGTLAVRKTRGGR